MLLLNKRFYFAIGFGLLLIPLFVMFCSGSRFTHRVSSNGRAEFLYVEGDLALFRLNSPDFGLGFASWQGFPDQVFQTGDIVQKLIVDRVNALALDKRNSTVFGRGIKWEGEAVKPQIQEGWFVIHGQNVEWYSSKEELIQKHKELTGQQVLRVSEFMSANRIRQSRANASRH
jgi:hypothetical protein